MYAALDSLNMLPLSDATPISMVFPGAAEASQAQKQTETSLKTTAKILLQMNQGNLADQPTANEGDGPSTSEALLQTENLVVENPLSAMVLYSQVVSLYRPFNHPEFNTLSVVTLTVIV